MKQEIKHPEKEFLHGLFSSAIACDGWLFVSGQGPLDMKTGLCISGTIEEETRRTLDHVGKILHEAGCGFQDVVRCNCYLAAIGDFDGFNSAYGEYFQTSRPARTTIQAGLVKGIKVEIDCIARIPNAK